MSNRADIPPRFTRLMSSNVLMQVHVSPDARFLILPVTDTKRRLTGWKVYETKTGQLLTATNHPEGHREGVWDQLHQARDWIIDTYYGST